MEIEFTYSPHSENTLDQREKMSFGHGRPSGPVIEKHFNLLQTNTLKGE